MTRTLNNWPSRSIKSICVKITSGGTPKRSRPEYFCEGTIPWVKTGELNDWIIDPKRISEWITDTALKQSSAKLFPANTVLMAMYGDGKTIGSLGLVQAPVSSNQACCALIPDPEVCDPFFLLYALMDRRRDLIRLAHGGAQRNLNGRIIGEFTIPVPPITIQKRVAQILRCYDDLIDNNARRVPILEEMARRVFDEWFIRFRGPGYKDWSSLNAGAGSLPNKWKAGKVEDIASFISRGIAPSYADDGLSIVINQKCIRDGRLSLGQSRRQSKRVSLEKTVVAGDVLINSTGVGTLGRVAQVERIGEHVTVDSHVTIVRAKPNVDRDFFGLALLRLQPTLEELGVGSTGQTELGRDRIKKLNLIIPPENVQKDFGRIVRPLRELAHVLDLQNNNLRTQRDLLLPKLVSGEIDVRRAEGILEAAE